MRIVITGVGGRVGRAIHFALSREHEVIGIDRTPCSAVTLIGDIADVGDPTLHQGCDGADAIVHVAALHAPHVGLVPDAEFERINVDGTRRVLDAAVAAGVERIVFTSTTAVYGHAARAHDAARWIDEQTPPEPVTIYHRTKLAAEALLREAAQGGGPAVRILRMSRCFPEPAPIMATYRLHRGVDARDVAQAHRLALTDAGAAHATYVVSGATPFQRADLRTLRVDASDVLRERVPRLVDEFELRDWSLPASIDRVYDAGLIQRELGWRPHYGYEEVLAMLDADWAEVLPPHRGAWSAAE